MRGIRVISGSAGPLKGTFNVNYPHSLQELKDSSNRSHQYFKSVFSSCVRSCQLWILYQVPDVEFLWINWRAQQSLCFERHDSLSEAAHITLKLYLPLSECTPICVEHDGWKFVSSSDKLHFPAQRNESNDAEIKYAYCSIRYWTNCSNRKDMYASLIRWNFQSTAGVPDAKAVVSLSHLLTVMIRSAVKASGSYNRSTLQQY